MRTKPLPGSTGRGRSRPLRKDALAAAPGLAAAGGAAPAAAAAAAAAAAHAAAVTAGVGGLAEGEASAAAAPMRMVELSEQQEEGAQQALAQMAQGVRLPPVASLWLATGLQRGVDWESGDGWLSCEGGHNAARPCNVVKGLALTMHHAACAAGGRGATAAQAPRGGGAAGGWRVCAGEPLILNVVCHALWGKNQVVLTCEARLPSNHITL